VTLVKTERYTLSERIRGIPTGAGVALTLTDGTQLRAALAEARADSFALWVPFGKTDLTGGQASTQKWIDYEDVYTVFSEGRLSLEKGASSSAAVVHLDEIRQIERVRRGSGAKGALLGFAVGAGLAALAASGCCGNPDVGPPQAFAAFLPLFGGLGAGWAMPSARATAAWN
jgi:hypothetical protein